MIGLYTHMRVTARGLVLGAALLASAAFSYAKEGAYSVRVPQVDADGNTIDGVVGRKNPIRAVRANG